MGEPLTPEAIAARQALDNDRALHFEAGVREAVKALRALGDAATDDTIRNRLLDAARSIAFEQLRTGACAQRRATGRMVVDAQTVEAPTTDG